MDPVLAALLTETVTLEAYTGTQDSYGTPQYAAPVQLPARVEYAPTRIVTAQGEERLSRARVFLDGTVTVDLRDRLTLPDTTQPALLVVAPMRDEVGAVDHIEIRV